MTRLNLLIIGSGAFGTALAYAFSAKHKVTLYARSTERAKAKPEIAKLCASFPETAFIEASSVFDGSATLEGFDAVLFCIPTQSFRYVLYPLSAHLPANVPLIATCKGIERGTNATPAEIMRDIFGENALAGYLAGPNLAAEMLQNLPTAADIAFDDSDIAREWAQKLSTPNFRLKGVKDVETLQYMAAFKNVAAIGAGIAESLGDNARAVWLTAILQDAQTLIEAQFNRKIETLNSFGAIGDFILTCTSPKSRNYAFGAQIGKLNALPENGVDLCEGVWTAPALQYQGEKLGLNLQALATLNDILKNRLEPRKILNFLAFTSNAVAS